MMSKLFYTQDHEYVRTGEGNALVGISEYAQSQLGDIVFVELPAVGTKFEKGAEMAVVESVKAASEIYAPVSLVITSVNQELEGAPDLVNSAPLAEGWLVKVSVSNESELESLMDETAYQAHTS